MRKHLVISLFFLFLPPVSYAQSFDTGWRITGSMNSTHRFHTATLLPNGSVLVAGGNGSVFIEGTPLNLLSGGKTAEIYEPATGTWRVSRSLHSSHAMHTATLLLNGHVLVAGGMNDSGTVTDTAELYDPITQTWTSTGRLNGPRANHTATLLPSGKVLVAGGLAVWNSGVMLQTAEVYDPDTGLWSTTGDMNTARERHTATLLPTGEVLVTGGFGGFKGNPPFLNTAELYEPATGTWSATGDSNNHDAFDALLLPDGKVLRTEGENSDELYDPAKQTWSLTGHALVPRTDGYTTTLMPNGEALLAGGFNYDLGNVGTELYDPGSGVWNSSGKMNTPRYGHTATLLSSGAVLVAGGIMESANIAVMSAELFQPGASDAIGVEFQPVVVQEGAKFFAAFSGTDVNAETWFDVRFRAAESTTDEVVMNWQRGAIKLHSVDAGTGAGTYTITGIRKHTEEDNHSGDFTPVTAALTLVLP